METNEKPRFGVDAMLGKLARFLRILGYDTLYWREQSDFEILKEASSNNRILITRDKKLCWKAIDEGIDVVCFTEPLPIHKLLSYMKKANLIELSFNPKKSRCPLCNGELAETSNPLLSYGKVGRKYFVCKNCGMIYWVGRHFYNIKRILGVAENEDC